MRPSTAVPSISRQLLSFAVIGTVSTVAYVALYSLLRVAAPATVANAGALVLTAVANTAANRRFTFDLRGPDGLARDHAGGLVAFVIALAITSSSIASLDAFAPDAGRFVEIGVLVAANVAATVVRFVLLRTWLLAPRGVTVSPRREAARR
ncbi:MAG TPA: GtrA family protein [Candidatus Limnocylindrales bacterium]|nr:GtrA family protein [Candidatus Limnocylindrales bacterium]